MDNPSKNALLTMLRHFKFYNTAENLKYWTTDLFDTIIKHGTQVGVYTSVATLPICRFQGKEYAILLEPLSSGSVNGDSDSTNKETTRILKTLKFANVEGYPDALVSKRKIIILGRLVGAQQLRGEHAQSRWIVAMDEKKYLWVLYTNGVDKANKAICRCKKACVYDAALDTAFGAPAKPGAVLLGRLIDLPMREGKELGYAPKVFRLEWETTRFDFENSGWKDDRWKDYEGMEGGKGKGGKGKDWKSAGRLSPENSYRSRMNETEDGIMTDAYEDGDGIMDDASSSGPFMHPDRLRLREEPDMDIQM